VGVERIRISHNVLPRTEGLAGGASLWSVLYVERLGRREEGVSIQIGALLGVHHCRNRNTEVGDRAPEIYQIRQLRVNNRT